jgi:hypothetical protein
MWQQIQRIVDRATTRILDSIANFLPGLIVLAVIVAVALLIALMTRYVLIRVLRGLDFDRYANQFGVTMGVEWPVGRSPSLFIARAAYWTILFLGLLVGLTALDATMPSQFAMSIFQFLPHLLAALFILIIGGLLARFLARSVLIGAVNMRIHYARALSLAVKWLLLIIAAAMALDHIGIGRTILLLAFGIVFGGIVLATALAIGLGARDVVARALERQVESSDTSKDRLDHV